MNYLWIYCFIIVFIRTESTVENSKISREQMREWSRKLGQKIYRTASTITKYSEMQRRFQTSNVELRRHNLTHLVHQFSENIHNVFEDKIRSIKKINSWTEEKALEHNTDVEMGKPSSSIYSGYVNAKKMETADNFSIVIPLKSNKRFGADVNFDYSAVHVPSFIYDKRDDIIEGIEWSGGLDEVFKSNYEENPTLMWQYFCSTLGFFRQYPAVKWPNTNRDKENPDLFDCRQRFWYTKAANSPKNIVILYDTSGSMMGLRREIGRRVVNTILDTLSDDDYVNVFNFSAETRPVVPCFKTNQLVQANLENIRELKVALEQEETEGVADFDLALKTAFNVLEDFRDERRLDSAHCNEAIMLITDGAPEYFDAMFNARNRDAPTRVFTYLVGREVDDTAEVLWMACHNKGYFVHISALGEVQEQVLKYMSVMSRPMVIQQQHETSWTQVYADVAIVEETDWLWTEKNEEMQWERSLRYKEFLRSLDKRDGGQFSIVDPLAVDEKDKVKLSGQKVAYFLSFGTTEPDEHILRSQDAEKDRVHQANVHRWGPERKHHFVISVSVPVFDQRNITINEGSAHWGQEKIAELLGVVGTDIPIEELKKLTSPFRLGVNGYAFIINSNGFIIFHPRWDPLFDDLLKPNYNSIDMSSMELVDSDEERNFAQSIMMLRKKMIDIPENRVDSTYLKIRIPEDEFRRVKTWPQEYAFTVINSTPYTLAVTIPRHQENYVGGEIELRLAHNNWLSYLNSPPSTRKWRINPSWEYCEMIKGNFTDADTSSPEGILLYFLKEIRRAANSWSWSTTKFRDQRSAPDAYSCDKELVQSLVFDANITQTFKLPSPHEYPEQILEELGVVIAFIATRSGLTRWIDYDTDIKPSATYIPFIEEHPHATEELWYKRAVDRFYLDKGASFIITAPYDSGTHDDAMLTATRAIFVRRGSKEAPVAVTGIQFTHDKFTQYFWNVTSKCSRNIDCNPCASPLNRLSNMNCYIIDDNGYVITASEKRDSGLFFGEIDGRIMNKLVEQNIYRRVRVVDYQAICTHSLGVSGAAHYLLTPIIALRNIIYWIIGKLVLLGLHFDLTIAEPYSYFVHEDYIIDDVKYEDQPNPNWQPFLPLASIEKTKLRPCHKEYNLYTYGEGYYSQLQSSGFHSGIIEDCDDIGNIGFYGVHLINETNLLLVMTDELCKHDAKYHRINIKGQEVSYPMEDEELENLTRLNPIVGQLCHIPYTPLYRKKPEAACMSFDINERELREDCGKGSTMANLFLKYQVFFTVTIILLLSQRSC